MISSEEHEAPIWTFSTIPGLMDMSRGIVDEILLKFPSENASCANLGTMEINSNLVQYLLQTDIHQKEQKRYNGKYKHYTEIFHLETQTGKTSIYYIHTLCYIVYNTIYI
jgi:hypothetical protein